jgi:hypothetical protein
MFIPKKRASEATGYIKVAGQFKPVFEIHYKAVYDDRFPRMRPQSEERNESQPSVSQPGKIGGYLRESLLKEELYQAAIELLTVHYEVEK